MKAVIIVDVPTAADLQKLLLALKNQTVFVVESVQVTGFAA